MAALPGGTVILLRAPVTARAGAFERAAAWLAEALVLEVEWHRPAPTEDTPGRASVYVRDMVMISRADLVLLFFATDEVSDGYSGTAHMLDKALDAARPVYAYAVDDDGNVTRVGEYDPDHLYADIAPSA